MNPSHRPGTQDPLKLEVVLAVCSCFINDAQSIEEQTDMVKMTATLLVEEISPSILSPHSTHHPLHFSKALCFLPLVMSISGCALLVQRLWLDPNKPLHNAPTMSNDNLGAARPALAISSCIRPHFSRCPVRGLQSKAGSPVQERLMFYFQQ